MLRHLLALVLIFLPFAAAAQTATLVADRIEIDADQALIAEGNVEVFYDDTRLTATRVRFDRRADSLTIEGPLTLSDGADTVILASSADLQPDLREGILRSARLVLNKQLQFAAAEIERGGGRYTRFARVAASSCQICEDGRAPLWEIRARRVIRDELERQLYFDDAQVRVVGLPVFYLPRLRLPDPTLERATGFTVPSIRNRTGLGLGIRVPYFIKLGDHADVTFAPYVSRSTTTLETRFRQEYKSGRLSFEGAVSRDDLRPDATRAYVIADGQFNLPKDFTLDLDLQLTSDDAYLFDYGYSERDRLESGLSVSRIRDNQILAAELISFRTLRSRELSIDNTLPNELLGFTLRERVMSDPVWGQAWYEIDGASLVRPSNTDGAGRDVGRLSAAFDWSTSRTLSYGIVGYAEAAFSADLYSINQDSAFKSTATRTTPAASVGLSWPHERITADGARHLIEPTIQLAWADTSGDIVPNEDSTIVEFDEGNLFALSRFPGTDAREQGFRANLGATWTRFDPEGWSFGVTAGRVLRFSDKTQFGTDTGLSGGISDWLLAGNLRIENRIHVLSRILFEDNLDVSRAETRFAWNTSRLDLAGTHIWRSANPADNRFTDLSEIMLDAAYQIDDFWTADADWRFDADGSNTTRAGLGLTYQNECIGMSLSLSRRFTSSTNVEPVTDLDFSVFLTGFGTGGERRAARRTCRR